MVNGEIELDLPSPDADASVDPERRRLEVLALLLVVLAVGKVLQGLLQALAVSQVVEGQPDVPTSTLLFLAAGGAEWSTVLALATAFGVLLLAGLRGASPLGRGVLAAIVLASGVVSALAIYLFQEVVRSDGDRYAPFGSGEAAPTSQVFLQRLSGAVAVGAIVAVAVGTTYLAWRAVNDGSLDAVAGGGVDDDDEPDDADASDGLDGAPEGGPADDTAWAPPG